MPANDGYWGPMNGTQRGFPLVPCRYHKLHHRSNEACPACYERKEGERKVEVLKKELAQVKAQLENSAGGSNGSKAM